MRSRRYLATRSFVRLALVGVAAVAVAVLVGTVCGIEWSPVGGGAVLVAASLAPGASRA